MPTYGFNAMETPDVASLQVSDDLNLRCYVAVVSSDTLEDQTIESEIRRVQENGEEITVWRGQVRAPQGANVICDSPKVLGIRDVDGPDVRPIFVVHWLEGTRVGTPALFHAFLDPTSDSWAWENADSIATSTFWLYDVAVVEGGDGYVVVHREDANDFTTYRFETVMNGWAGFAFAQGYTIDCEPGGLLAVYAHNTDANIAFAWEREVDIANPNQGEIWCRRMDLVTGANGASWQAMAIVSPAFFTAGGWKRRSAQRWVLEVELMPVTESELVLTPVSTDMSAVAWQTQNPSTGAVFGGTGLTWHVRMLSRPYGRPNGLTTSPTNQIFAIVGHSEFTSSEYNQSAAFVVELPSMDEDFQQRMLLAGSVNLRLVDARACGAHPTSTGAAPRSANGRRTNHVSSVAPPSTSRPDYGYTCELKSYTVALCVYTRVVAAPNPLIGSQPDVPTVIVPQQTSVVGYSVHAEEPWIRQRGDDPGTNLQNFKGVYAWHPYQPVPTADMLVIAGGLPQVYDGRHVVEIGWAWYPEIIDVSFDSVGSGLAAGVYSYTAIYEHVLNGRVHRSAPATPFTIDVDDGVNPTFGTTVNVKCATLSNRFDTDAALPHAQIILYRADPGSTVYRRVWGLISGGSFEVQSTARNLPDVSSVNIGDAVSDISRHDLLPYQFIDGNWTPLVPAMPPAASVGWLWRDRIVLVPSEEPNTFWYSKQLRPGDGSSIIAAPEFSPVNVFRFDAEAIRVTAGVGMDSHSIVMADNAVFALDGRFNDDNGFGADLSLTLIHRGVGCLDQRSVVRTDIGVFFQSDRGIEFMDKGWALSNVTIGSSVEDDVRASGNLRAAIWVEEARQVVFFGNAAADGEPIALVYHYVEKIWTRFTLPEGDQTIIGDGDSWMSQNADACVWREGGEQLQVVLQQGALLVQRDRNDEDLHIDQVRLGTGGQSSDTSAYSGFDIEVGWLSLAGLAGYKRVWKVLAIHDPIVEDAPGLRLDIDSDIHSGEYPQTEASTETLTRPAPSVGVSDFRPAIQKLSGMRLRLRRNGSFTELPTWSVLGFALELGIKPGVRKTASSQRGT